MRSRTHVGLLSLATLFVSTPVCSAAVPWVGFSLRHAAILVEDGAGVDAPSATDHFGFSVAAGDFDRDGVDDLATGVPGNDCSDAVLDCGAVVVRYGIAGRGLSPESVVVRQQGIDLPDGAESNEQFGYAVAAGDLNGDGHDDLAVGVPGNKVPSSSNPDLRIATGSIDVSFGWSGGLTDWTIEFVPGRFGLPGGPSFNSEFGRAVAFGDFDGDGRDDVAIGAPNDTVPCPNSSCRAGSVLVFGRDADGANAGYEIYQGHPGLPGTPKVNERFGQALATGDFNADGFDDLAIGAPFDEEAGGVLILYGSPWSLLFATHQALTQGELGEPSEAGDRFGEALAAGDFDGDGYDDLAMSSAYEDGPGGLPRDAGLVLVAQGSPGGVTSMVTSLTQDDLFGPGSSETGDLFGATLAAGDFDGDGIEDLAIGHEGEDGSNTDSGAVTVVTGTAQGLTGAKRMVRPSVERGRWLIPDVEYGGPLYGFALATGDFDANGFSDLAIGAPNRDTNGKTDSGGLVVFYGTLFADGFESQSTEAWSTATH